MKPSTPVRVQAFCRAHKGELTYLGSFYGHFKIAVSPQGTRVLQKEGFKITPTEDQHEGKPVVTCKPS